MKCVQKIVSGRINMNNLYVNMQDVIGELAYEHGLPPISFENLVLLGQRVVIIYNLDHQAKKITFDVMCHYIKKFIETPFGLNTLKSLL